MLRKGDTEIRFHCPFCKESKKIPKLEIAIDGSDFGSFQCWICHEKGRSFRSLFKKLKVNSSYYSKLYKITGEFKPIFYEKEYSESLSLPKEFISLIDTKEKTFEYYNVLSYLQKRNITDCDIIRYNIGYCTQGDYRQMIIIPSYDKNGNLNFFSARSYYDNSFIKHKLAPTSKNIIGFELFINWNEPINIVEGSFDAIAVKNNAIPLFGTIMSSYLKEAIILNGVERVNVILDNDALEEAMKIYNYLDKYEIKVHLIQLEGKDPSSIGFEKVNQLINDSKPMDFSNLIQTKLKL